MNVIGKGLASLIPRRSRDEAIEEIESIEEEEVVEQPEDVEEAEAVAEEPEEELAEEADETEDEAGEEPAEAEEEADDTVAVEVAEDEAEAQPEAEVEEAEEEAEPAAEVAPAKVLNVIEDFDELDEMEAEPLPEKPNVSPLPLDKKEETPASESLFAPTTPLPPEVVAAATEKMKKPQEQTVAEEKTPVASEEVTAKKEVVEIVVPKKVNAEAPKIKNSTPKEKKAVGVEFDRVLGETVEYIALGDIAVNPLQPRRTFDDEELEELVQSLGQHGMLQPLVVMEQPDGSYQLLAGERRMRAAKRLGWREVPCVVRKGVEGDRHRLELALTENVQRQNLNPIEEALGYKQLNEEYGMSHEEIGLRVGRSRVGITNILRILQLPAEIQRGLIEGKITIGHARAILMIPDTDKQIRFYEHVLDEGLTVRKTENRARNIQRSMNVNDPLRNKSRGRHELALKYDGQLQEKYGYNARVKFNQQKNRFEVTFIAYNEPEANEMCGRLLGTEALPENVDSDIIED